MWEVRKAKKEDASRIVEMARDYDEFLMPYVLNEFVVRNYSDQLFVAEQVVYKEPPKPPTYEVGGAVHYLDGRVDGSDTARCDKVCCFLLNVKQVPEDIITQFLLKEGKVAFLGHIICPGKGSFYAILEELKGQYDELWCWMSVVGPSYESYKRYGFQFGAERTFWNIYKCDYSRFVLGKWRREV